MKTKTPAPALQGPFATKIPTTRRDRMERMQVETIQLDEQRWQEWVEKGKLRDQAQKRRWRIIGGVVGALLLFASGVYGWSFT